MRHTDTNFLGAVTPNALNRLGHHRDQALATFKAKTLRSRVFTTQGALQTLCTVQLPQNIQALLRTEFGRTTHRLHATHDPVSLLGIDNVHEFGAHLRAIGCLKIRPDLRQRRLSTPEIHGAYLKRCIQVCVAELVKAQR